MSNSFNKRTPNQQQTTDSIAPATYKNSTSLDPQSKSGYFIFNELNKRIKKNKLSNTIDDGRVLEVLGDGQKVKYRILTQTPEIDDKNQKDGYMEDYLIKVRTRNDIGTKTDPEQILINEYKETLTDSEKQQVRKKYLYAVAEHDTFAPKRPTSFFGEAPKQGDVVKLYYNNYILDSGEEIKGFYEIVNNNHDYFEKGDNSFSEFLKNFRSKYEEAFKKIAPLYADGKVPNVEGYTDQQSEPVPESVRVGDIDILPPPNVTDLTDARTPHYSVRAPLPGDTAYHSAELYLRVIKQFNVSSNPRYKNRDKNYRNGTTKRATFCTLFVGDVTIAMGTPVPYSTLRRMELRNDTQLPLPGSGYNDTGWKYWVTPPNLYEDPRNIEEFGAELMIAWCAGSIGRKYGWVRVEADEAQRQADMGYTTVVGGPGTGHIALVRPSLIDSTGKKIPFNPSKGPAIAQAGGNNQDEGIFAINGYGSTKFKLLYYFTNKSDKMQVQLTDEQKMNLEQAKREIEGEDSPIIQAQAQPEVEDPETSLVQETT